MLGYKFNDCNKNLSNIFLNTIQSQLSVNVNTGLSTEMRAHFFLVTSSACATYLWANMAAPAPVITCAFQLVGQKLILPFGSDLSPLVKFHGPKYIPLAKVSSIVMANLGVLPHRRAGECDPTEEHSWWVIRATTLHSCLCNSFFFGSPHTALSLFWPIDMDMDEFIREDTAQTVQIWRKQESKENFKKSIKMQNLKESMLIIINLPL